MRGSSKPAEISVMEMEAVHLCVRIFEEGGLSVELTAGDKNVDFLASMVCTLLRRSIETGLIDISKQTDSISLRIKNQH